MVHVAKKLLVDDKITACAKQKYVSWVLHVPSVASKHVQVRKKLVLIMGANMTCLAVKHWKFGVGVCCRLDLFLRNKIFLARMLRIISGVWCFWARICLKFEKNEIWAKGADQKHINNLPLARQFAFKLMAFKLQMFGCSKTCHVWQPIRTCFFFVSCPRLEATDSKVSNRKTFCLHEKRLLIKLFCALSNLLFIFYVPLLGSQPTF